MRKYRDPRLIGLDQLCRAGEEADAADPGLYAREVAAGRGDDVAILCTTSGTTSLPKLAMLQSGPFLRHALAYLRRDPKWPLDDYVSVLPLPWVMEQVYAVAQALIGRVIVNFVEEPETMMADLREIGPNFLLLAPRVWESIAADVRSRMMDFDLDEAADVRARNEPRRGGARSRPALAARRCAAVSRSPRPAGVHQPRSRRRPAAPRSAPRPSASSSPWACRCASSTARRNWPARIRYMRPDDVNFDSVGTPFDTSDVRIDHPDENGVGEIVARTMGMFSGYYKNEEATRAELRDGWLHTGDAGYFDKENGHLVVIDRIKDIATTSGGARFSPMFIENKLKFSPYIAEAVILGHGRPWLAAIICIRFPIVAKWAEQRRIAFTNYTNLAGRPEAYTLLREEVEKVNATLPEAHRIRKFLLLYKELDPDDGELTRTRKVRRGVINERYAEIIDAVYGDRESVHVDTLDHLPGWDQVADRHRSAGGDGGGAGACPAAGGGVASDDAIPMPSPSPCSPGRHPLPAGEGR